jgi:poly(3-hydroxyalkanoate) synthetase
MMQADPAGLHDVSRALPISPFLWPLVLSAAATRVAAAFLQGLAAKSASAASQGAVGPAWTTDNSVALELPSMLLRDFSAGGSGRPTLICAPYALHGATVADFAPGHSIVEALRRNGLSRVFVTDWRSATPDMRYFGIDSYLADLNVVVDELASPVDLIGLCQGGWLSLVYAARFPGKVRRLVLVGAPVDFHAGDSALSRTVGSLPPAVFENLVGLGEGRVLGHHVLDAWAPMLDAAAADRVLQIAPNLGADERHALEARFREWYAWTVNLPGTYYLETIERLYRENEIATGRFVALGRRIDLADVRAPLFLLAARDDELVAPEQLLWAARLVGTPTGAIQTAVEAGGHLSLFLGARTLAGSWRADRALACG